jgi:HD-GYP domain-containing protein (c-di-GMP phosphodiesterase class II)
LPPSEEDLAELSALVIPGLIELMDLKDQDTIRHSSRVQKLVSDFIPVLISKKILRANDEALLWVSAILHDMGKLFILDSILGSPRTLNETEYEHVRGHPGRGHNLLHQVGLPREILGAVRHHHERWDGRRKGRFPGYPDGLKSRTIPLFARIISLADTYDALISERPYKKPLTPSQARAVIRKNLGRQFDPRLGRLFLAKIARDERRDRALHKSRKKLEKKPRAG